ncbi:MAG: hypothetical protein R3344_12410 [Acidobacteriota bacterium]|nr:hypothetical protein [Acidobacteriota bacterium]
MKRSQVTLLVGVFLAAGLLVGSTAATGSTAAKQRTSIELKQAPFNVRGPFTVYPRGPGRVKFDTGTWTGSSPGPGSRGTRDGQDFEIVRGTDVLEGKRGTLTIRQSGRIYSAGHSTEAGLGTWSLIKGTGSYAGLKGGGRWAWALDEKENGYLRYDGFLAPR